MAIEFMKKKKNAKKINHFSVVFMKLAESWQINEEILSSIEEFPCVLYYNKHI